MDQREFKSSPRRHGHLRLPDDRLNAYARARSASLREGRDVDTDFAVVPDWFPVENAGAGLAVGDVDGDGRPDLVVLMVDAPQGANAGYYR
ncbi:MAG TPA: FG-GAP repeat protein, partial [Acidimicrobiia bacterium]|nr:FG-GAP repeat protein [Acidimicrobiia bacterium]